MTNEKAIRLVVLDKIAQEKGWKNWADFKVRVADVFVILTVQRAVELAFVAGQKQEQEEWKEKIENKDFDCFLKRGMFMNRNGDFEDIAEIDVEKLKEFLLETLLQGGEKKE